MVDIDKKAYLSSDPWTHMRKAQLRAERFRLMKLGFIKPVSMMPPQLMVKVDGQWRPEIKTFPSQDNLACPPIA